MALPIALGEGLGEAKFGSIAALGALFIGFCDLDDPHRSRIWTLGVAIALGALFMASGKPSETCRG